MRVYVCVKESVSMCLSVHFSFVCGLRVCVCVCVCVCERKAGVSLFKPSRASPHHFLTLFPACSHLQFLFSQHHPPCFVQRYLCQRCQDVLQGDDGQCRTGQHRGKVSLQGHCCRRCRLTLSHCTLQLKV